MRRQVKGIASVFLTAALVPISNAENGYKVLEGHLDAINVSDYTKPAAQRSGCRGPFNSKGALCLKHIEHLCSKRPPISPFYDPVNVALQHSCWCAVLPNKLETGRINPKGTTLVLDLDETLINARHMRDIKDLPSIEDPSQVIIRQAVLPENFDIANLGCGKNKAIRVRIRPFALQFLRKAFELFDNVVVYTAGSARYAWAVCGYFLAHLPGHRFSVILDRRYCLPPVNRDTKKVTLPLMVKDLDRLPIDFSKAVMLDDKWHCIVQAENALPIVRFIDDISDKDLLRVLNLFEQWMPSLKSGQTDIRDLIAKVDLVDDEHVKQLEKLKTHLLEGIEASGDIEGFLHDVLNTVQGSLHMEQYDQFDEEAKRHVEHYKAICHCYLTELCQELLKGTSPDRLPMRLDPRFFARAHVYKEAFAFVEIQRLREEAQDEGGKMYKRHLEDIQGVSWRGAPLADTRHNTGPRIVQDLEGKTTDSKTGFIDNIHPINDNEDMARHFTEPPTHVLEWDKPTHEFHPSAEAFWA